MGPEAHEVFAAFRDVLTASQVEYRLHHHKPVLSYADAREVSEELGLNGTEGKVVVCRADGGYAVYLTTEGKRFDARQLKRLLQVKKLRLATGDELRGQFGAEPGAAYPFSFSADIPIVVDPDIYGIDVLLFSTPLPTVTLEISGEALGAILARLPNTTHDAPPE